MMGAAMGAAFSGPTYSGWMAGALVGTVVGAGHDRWGGAFQNMGVQAVVGAGTGCASWTVLMIVTEYQKNIAREGLFVALGASLLAGLVGLIAGAFSGGLIGLAVSGAGHGLLRLPLRGRARMAALSALGLASWFCVKAVAPAAKSEPAPALDQRAPATR